MTRGETRQRSGLLKSKMLGTFIKLNDEEGTYFPESPQVSIVREDGNPRIQIILQLVQLVELPGFL